MMNKLTKQQIIEFKMEKLNNLKRLARTRAFYNERPLDKLEIRGHMRGQIYNGHIVEIAAFAVLGVYQQFAPHYINIYTSLAQDKQHADLSIKLDDGRIHYIDIKSCYSFQVNRFYGASNTISLHFDDTGFISLLNILNHVGIEESMIRKEIGRENFFKLVAKANDVWKHYITEFSLERI